MSDINKKKSKTILILSPSHIGDALLITPSIKLLRKNFINSEISVLSCEFTSEVFTNNPYIDKIILENPENFKKLKKIKYDILVNFSPAVKDFIKAKKIKADLRIGSYYKNMIISSVVSKICLHKRLENPEDPGLYKKQNKKIRHEAEQNSDILKLLEINNVGKTGNLELYLNKSDLVFAENILRDIKNRYSEITGIQVSSRWFWKECADYGLEYFINEISDVFNNTGFVCLFDKKDKKLISGLKKKIKKDNVFFIESMDLKKYASVISMLDIIITVHSGTTHISAAVGTPSGVIFNKEYFNYFSKRESPWMVQHKTIKKPYSEKEIIKLNSREIRNAIKDHSREIINSVKKL